MLIEVKHESKTISLLRSENIVYVRKEGDTGKIVYDNLGERQEFINISNIDEVMRNWKRHENK